jgi:two-component system response regulator YesN
VNRRVRAVTAGAAARGGPAPGPGATALAGRAPGAGGTRLYEEPASGASGVRAPGPPDALEGRAPRRSTVPQGPGPGPRAARYAYPFDLEMRLRQALIAGDEDAARGALNGLMDHLRRQSAGLQRLKSDAIHLAVVLVRKCLQAGLGVEEILADAAAWTASILAAPGTDAVAAELEAVAARLMEACRSQRGPSRRRSAEMARRYIDAHFQQDLTLHEVARVVNLSYSYLSRVFARETGTTFQDYLASARVTAAKDLLRGTDLRIEEISALVGYDDPSHFIRVFKARVGVTPGRFQRCAAG